MATHIKDGNNRVEKRIFPYFKRTKNQMKSKNESHNDESFKIKKPVKRKEVDQKRMKKQHNRNQKRKKNR